jgi:CheY-like chemotaxis protein
MLAPARGAPARGAIWPLTAPRWRRTIAGLCFCLVAMPYRVAFLGFSEFERKALASYFRLGLNRTPSYELVATLTDAEFLVADADHGPSVQLVQATERAAETVFIGAQAPVGATAWMMRPIDALHVMRELDVMVALAGGMPSVDERGRQTTVIQPPRRERAAAVGDSPAAALLPVPGQSSAPSTLEAAAAQLAAPPLIAVLPTVLPRPAPAAPAPAQPDQPAPPPAPPRTLLVDDSTLALRFLASRLSRWQMDIDSATTSDKALELLERNTYDFVFLDLELGEDSELDGLALCQHIKQMPAAMNTAVIMVSAHHDQTDRVRGALAGCDAYLGKPLDEVDLQRLLLRQGLKAPKDEDITSA